MLNIVWEDDFFLVIQKPAGITVTNADSVKDQTIEDLVKTELKIKVERSGIVHRLDKDTSGLLIIAKTLEIKEAFHLLFSERKIKKEYMTLVHSSFVEQSGTVDAPILRNPRNRERFIVGEGGRDSITNFVVTENIDVDLDRLEKISHSYTKKERNFYEDEASKYALLKILPVTGRTHQIRVHMKYIQHCLVADEFYTGRKLYRLDKTWCARQFLHASSLSFIHPITQKEIKVDSELPEDLKQALAFIKN